ncbi:MAG TPA: diacylglycerol kinase family protein [Candidatus Eremiobacteraceae bacterium]|nr:diacylglycerol kinase family protein [Candidatus Eremiobacteraceae bacterium]
MRQAFIDQPNFRRQLGFALVAIALGAFLRFDATHWLVLSAAIGLVLAAELFNTSLEHIVDLIQPDDHPLARAAKHAGAGAVLIASLMAVAAGIYLYGAPLLGILAGR